MIVVREMSEADLDRAVEWAAREGWNPGLADAAAFRAADPGGFLMGWAGETPVTAISAVRYGEDFGFVGFYIAVPEARGKGYGWATWQAAMARLEGRTVGLDGVVAQQSNYAKSGFALAHRNVRYGGNPDVTLVSGNIRNVGVETAPAIISYDRAFFPAPRADFLRAWIEGEGRESYAYIEDGKIKGYGTVRRCREGYKIGPLFADDSFIADQLFRALAAEAHDGPVFLDVPEPNADAVTLATRYGLAPVFETARMYRGPAPDVPLGRIYGITTFELG